MKLRYQRVLAACTLLLFTLGMWVVVSFRPLPVNAQNPPAAASASAAKASVPDATKLKIRDVQHRMDAKQLQAAQLQAQLQQLVAGYQQDAAQLEVLKTAAYKEAGVDSKTFDLDLESWTFKRIAVDQPPAPAKQPAKEPPKEPAKRP